MPFLGLPDAIRQVVRTTNAIESLNARYRRGAQACGHFPNEQAALKRLHLAALALDPQAAAAGAGTTAGSPPSASSTSSSTAALPSDECGPISSPTNS